MTVEQLKGLYEFGMEAAQSLPPPGVFLRGSPEFFEARNARGVAFRAVVPWADENKKGFLKVLWDLSREEMSAKHIQPLVRKDGKLWRVKKCRGDQAFPFATTTTEVPLDSLQPIAQIKTLHGFSFYGVFKPTADEVHRSIPEHLRAQLAFFETEGPDTVDDLNREQVALDAGYHVALTTLYAMKKDPGK